MVTPPAAARPPRPPGRPQTNRAAPVRRVSPQQHASARIGTLGEQTEGRRRSPCALRPQVTHGDHICPVTAWVQAIFDTVSPVAPSGQEPSSHATATRCSTLRLHASGRVMIPRYLIVYLIVDSLSRGTAPSCGATCDLGLRAGPQLAQRLSHRSHRRCQPALRDGARALAPRLRSRAVALAALNATRASPPVWLPLPSFSVLTLSTLLVRGTSSRRLRRPAP